MTGLMAQIEFLMVGGAFMLILLGLGVAVFIPGIDRWSKRFFTAFFMILTFYGVFGVVDLIIRDRPDMIPLLDICYFFESLFSSILIPLLTIYLLHCCGEDLRTSRLLCIIAALTVVFLIMLALSPFTSLFYSATPENYLIRGPLYPLMIVLIDVTMLLNLSGLIRRRNILSKKYYYAFLVSFLPMTAAMLIHLFVSVFTFFEISLSICALAMFVIILSDQIEQNMRQQREIAHQRASIMVLQMRPHFIHNTMTGIYYLCGQDPKKAQQVTMDFNTYLRKNFTAIVSEKPVPFSEELEHTRAYLAVEQVQFEDLLFVDFDTPYISFLIPPLTLQPIVENAVKHGMDPDSEPLHISIRTRETDSGSEIIVEDNGPGFDPADVGEPHLTLTNIRQRLDFMCGGKMEITPRETGGTMVKVTIPGNHNMENNQ